MRYIKESDIYKLFEESNGIVKLHVVQIDELPRADVAEVKHGEWINHFDDLFPEESTQECSICHKEEFITLLNDNYCPNCGVKMDGGKR